MREEDEEARQGVFELSWPLPGQSVCAQHRQRAWAGRSAPLARRSFLREEVLDEHVDVAAALAQRRHTRRHDGHAEVQVLPEGAGRDELPQVAMGRGDDPRVEGLPCVRSDSAELARLQGSQQLGLERERELAEFVQKECSSLGLLERSRALADGAGERAAHMSEELRLDHIGSDGAAVEDRERTVLARASIVDCASQELLAGARFPQEQDRLGDPRGAFELGEEGAHDDARSEHFGPGLSGELESGTSTGLPPTRIERRVPPMVTTVPTASNASDT